MKQLLFRSTAILAATLFFTVAHAAPKPKPAPFYVSTVFADITPPVGSLLAGYASNVVSEACHDPLTVSGLIMKDGKKTAVLLSFDLLALEDCIIKEMRKKIAAIVKCGESDVILSCTHTHGGPHSRKTYSAPFDENYCKSMMAKTLAAVEEANKKPFANVRVCFYSTRVDVNTSRRYTGPENEARFTPKHRYLEPMVDNTGIDKELGLVYFWDVDNQKPLAIIGNYAAHPLVSRATGLAGNTITADYPGRYRELVKESTGAFTIFTSGACGEAFPIDSESGFLSLDTIAKPLAVATNISMIGSLRNADKFRINKPELRSAIIKKKMPLRKDKKLFPPRYENPDEYELEIQLLAIGDICFVGVPGEFSSKIGLEIKWHSPFRRTWILYNSTGYNGYFSTANDFVSGGYESTRGQHFKVRTALQLLEATVDGLFQLRDNKIELKPYRP